VSSPIDYCGEGPVDAAVARRLIVAVGGQPGTDYGTPRGARGKDALDKRVKGLVVAARHGRRVLVLRDLDAEPCAGPVIRRLAPDPPSTFCLRLAVRAVEAWLLADHDGLAKGLKVRKDGLPPQPETLADPKGELRRIGKRSRNAEVRSQCTASPQVFGALASSLAADCWDPRRAAKRAPSLARALAHLERLL
ncbi:MAG: hypothetical protein SNJ73_05640, partial [Acetobacteraceae bacterium]